MFVLLSVRPPRRRHVTRHIATLVHANIPTRFLRLRQIPEESHHGCVCPLRFPRNNPCRPPAVAARPRSGGRWRYSPEIPQAPSRLRRRAHRKSSAHPYRVVWPWGSSWASDRHRDLTTSATAPVCAHSWLLPSVAVMAARMFVIMPFTQYPFGRST